MSTGNCLNDAIAQCHAAIILFSKRTLGSEWVEIEAACLYHRVHTDCDFTLIMATEPLSVERVREEIRRVMLPGPPLPDETPAEPYCSDDTAMPPPEVRLLIHYAALALGEAGPWVQPGPPHALPAALAAGLPQPVEESALGLELRGDSGGLVLHLIEPVPGGPQIQVPGPLPVRLHVAPADAPRARAIAAWLSA